jgi:hypothetical protein
VSAGEQNRAIARAWMRAFNAYDVDALVALYADDATHTSPKIRALHPDTGGQLVGKPALAAWWRASNARLPGLRYEETAVTADDHSVVIEYIRHTPDGPPAPVAEVFEIIGEKSLPRAFITASCYTDGDVPSS